MLTFEEVEIVRDGAVKLGPVSLKVDPSRRTIVLGHNGAGKSLFLRTAHGLITPEAGQVAWHGDAAALSRTERGFVFQRTPIMRRSVFDNVAFPLLARNIGKTDRKTQVEDVLRIAGLLDWADNPAATLSGGEMQRLALARALVTKPATILLDEPAASLDPASTQLLEDLVLTAHANGAGIIMSTHDLGQAARLAQDVILLDAGQLALHVAADEFFGETAPEMARTYRAGTLAPRQ